MNTAIAYAIAGTARPVIDDMSSQSNVHVQRIPVRSMINTTAVQTIMPRNKLVGICPDLSPYFCCCFAYTSHTHSHYPYKIRTKDPSKQFAMMTLIFFVFVQFHSILLAVQVINVEMSVLANTSMYRYPNLFSVQIST